MVKSEEYKMVQVAWSDSMRGGFDWEHFEKPDIKPADVMSVGWLLEDTDTHVIVAHSAYIDEGKLVVWGKMAIPKSCIGEIRVLEAGKNLYAA